jgi:hypothetical protein
MHKPQATLPPLRRLRVITYRVTLDVPLQLVIKVSNLLRKRRKELGTRNGTRALTCYQQAVFILAWFRDRPGLSRLGQGFGISQATAYRYKDEGVEVLRALAPTLHDTLEKAAEQGLPYLILDGTHIASDRRADKKTSKKGTEIDKWYSGKAHHHAGLVQPSPVPPASRCGSPPRGVRYQGERTFALMSRRWRAIRHVSADPSEGWCMRRLVCGRTGLVRAGLALRACRSALVRRAARRRA